MDPNDLSMRDSMDLVSAVVCRHCHRAMVGVSLYLHVYTLLAFFIVIRSYESM